MSSEPAEALTEAPRVLARLAGNRPTPPRPVKIGENWQTTFANPFLKNKSFVLTSRLISLTQVSGSAAYCVEQKALIPRNAQGTENVKFVMTYYMDIKRQHLVKEELNIDNFPLSPTQDAGAIKFVVHTERIDTSAGKQ